MHLGQLSTNDSWSPRVSEHDGEERMDLSSSVLELYFREGGHVLAKIAGYTLKSDFYDFGRFFENERILYPELHQYL